MLVPQRSWRDLEGSKTVRRGQEAFRAAHSVPRMVAPGLTGEQRSRSNLLPEP